MICLYDFICFTIISFNIFSFNINIMFEGRKHISLTNSLINVKFAFEYFQFYIILRK
jgi:hypothetical protein